MLPYVLLGAGALVALVLVVAAMQPPTFRVSRSAVMAAPPGDVFEQVNDLHNWRRWSPWERMDPNLQRTYDGAASGAGAAYSWVGNKQVGEGRMTILESRPSELIRIKLEFFKPFAATNETGFTFRPEGEQTHMTWDMVGQRSFCFKVMGLVMSMDRMVGRQFEEGLRKLQAVVESPRERPQPDLQPTSV